MRASQRFSRATPAFFGISTANLSPNPENLDSDHFVVFFFKKMKKKRKEYI